MKHMNISEKTPIEINKIRPETLKLLGHEIKVYSAPPGHRLDTSKIARVSRGNGVFDVFINVGKLFVDRGMLDSCIPENELWPDYKHDHVTNLQQSPDANVRSAVDQTLTNHIASVNASGSTYYLDPIEIATFRQNLQKIVELEKDIDGGNKGNTFPIAIARAGIPMTSMLGFQQDEMLIIDAKRLNLVKGIGKIGIGKIGIGLRLPNNISLQDLIKLLQNQSVLLADPALATFSTHLGFLSFCIANGINLNGFNCLAMVSSQQGLQLGNEVLDEIGMNNGHIITAGIYPRLTGGEHPYYIQTANKKFAAGDAGDFSDLLLPPGDGYRKVWPDVIASEQIKKLLKNFPEINWNQYLNRSVTLDLITLMNHLLLKEKPDLPHDALGKALQI